MRIYQGIACTQALIECWLKILRMWIQGKHCKYADWERKRAVGEVYIIGTGSSAASLLQGKKRRLIEGSYSIGINKAIFTGLDINLYFIELDSDEDVNSLYFERMHEIVLKRPDVRFYISRTKSSRRLPRTIRQNCRIYMTLRIRRFWWEKLGKNIYIESILSLCKSRKVVACLCNSSSLERVVSFCLGSDIRKIHLCGIDLYDSRQFKEFSGRYAILNKKNPSAMHATNCRDKFKEINVTEVIDCLSQAALTRGGKMVVENNRSLLSTVLETEEIG